MGDPELLRNLSMVADRKIPVVETFGPTFQGEGSLAGLPTWFLRTGGCDYDCTMCDSRHAVDADAVSLVPRLTGDEIGDRLIKEMGIIKWVTFSGGNPCIWEGLGDTVDILEAHNKCVTIETQGTVIPEWLASCSFATISPKSPGMGERCDFEVLDAFIAKTSEVLVPCSLKIVVFPGVQGDYKEDLDFAESVRERYPYESFYLSQGNSLFAAREHPGNELMHGYPKLLDAVYKRPKLLGDVYVLPQLHVWLWGNKVGV